jgi:poly-gamma-glutamate capsule biosynthesis protein CapA/YwtB (metallophosphatase superfamily)
MTPKQAFDYLTSVGAHFVSSENNRVITSGCEGAPQDVAIKFADAANVWNSHVNACSSAAKHALAEAGAE